MTDTCEHLELSLVNALGARFDDDTNENLQVTKMDSDRSHTHDEIFSYLQADWEKEEMMKLQDAFKRPLDASEESDDVRDTERRQLGIASEYVAGLQEMYMCSVTPSSIASLESVSKSEDVSFNGELVQSIEGSSATEAPPRFASRLLNDVLFRARVSGRTAMPNDFLSAGTLLRRAIELLKTDTADNDALSCVNQKTVRALIAKWRSTNYLYSTPRLHKVDVARMYDNAKVFGKFSNINGDVRSSQMNDIMSGKEQHLLKVKKKVANSEKREDMSKRKKLKDAASLVASKSIIDLVINAVRVDVERFEASRKSQMALEAANGDEDANIEASTVNDNDVSLDDDDEYSPPVIRLSDVPKPSLATLFQAKDPDGTGWMSFSHAMLAVDEAKLLTTPTEMFILASKLIKDNERNGSLPWTTLLDLIGTSKPSVGGDWTSKSLLNNFQAWETAVQAVLTKRQGFCGPDDVSKLILCQPSVTAQFTKTHMRRYSVALSQHPVLQSPFFLRTSSGMKEQHETLSTVLRAFDVDLQLAVTSGDVNYALQCVGVKLKKTALEQFCEIYKFPKGRTGREDDMYGDSICSSKFGVPFPDIDCERMLLSIAPGAAILFQDKESDGISNSHFLDDDVNGFGIDTPLDIDAMLAMISSKVFAKFLRLRASLLSLPEPRNVSMAEFTSTCEACDVEVFEMDLEFLLDFCRSDQEDSKLDAIRFMWILAVSTTPDSIAYQAPPMQVVEIGVN